MRIRRRRRNYWPVFVVILAAVGVFALVYYVMASSIKSSPVYNADKVLYIVKADDFYSFILVNSSNETIKVLYVKVGLYDPKTGVYVTGDPSEDYDFFKSVFGITTPYEIHLDLSGSGFDEFSRALVGRKTSGMAELLRSMKRRNGFFDVFKVGKIASEFSGRSNMDGAALLKLLDSVRSFDIDEKIVKGLTSKPVEIEIAGDGKYERIYLDSREREDIKEFLGVEG